MKRILCLLIIALGTSHLSAQQPAPPAAAPMPPMEDVVGQQAAALEAELGKYKDTSPEAAEAMVKLVDLYHKDGRLFGLVRIAQQFVAAHPTDPRHAVVMIKLIDGQEALSRNKELAATIRQFVARYPSDGNVPALEVRLADALMQMEDRLKTAEACKAVWQRHGGSEIGRRYGVSAIYHYNAVASVESITQAAQVGEDMLDKLPPGEFSKEVANQSFYDWRRIGQWVKSSAVGTKIFQKGLAGDPESQRYLHMLMAENHANVSQFANAVQSLQAARAIRDDQVVHYSLILRMYNAGAKPNEMNEIVQTYTQKYPTRPDRSHGVSYLALSCIANNEKPRAIGLLAAFLADDPAFNGNAAVFVRENGAEPPQLADSEQKLLAALAQNKPGQYYLRYVLATELYRDRLKDLPKARNMFRELITKSPSDDGHTTGAVDWLLYNSADDAEFNRDLQMILAARKQFPHIGALRDSVKNWANTAKQNKDYAAKAAIAQAEFAKVAEDPTVAPWNKLGNALAQSQTDAAAAIRDQLLAPATFDPMSEQAARLLLDAQGVYYRHHAPGDKRNQTIRIFAQYAKRFPQDYGVAQAWLEAATDYGKPEEMKPAAENFLKFPPEALNADNWRRLMIAADQNKDANMVRAAWNWMQAAQTKFAGKDPTYASTIGDVLVKYQMENEAVAHWTVYLTHDRKHPESRECAVRLLARIKEVPARIAFIQEMVKHDTDFHGRYAQWLADEYFRANDIANFEAILKAAQVRQLERPLRSGDYEYNQIGTWLDTTRANKEMKDDVKLKVYVVLRDLGVQPIAATANLVVLENTPVPEGGKVKRLLDLQQSTRIIGDDWPGWDRVGGFAQAAIGKKDYVSASVLATGMLANIPNVDEARKKVARDFVTQSLSRVGGVGLTIDDSSPLAPLLQAAMYHRLGDERLAFDTYLANKKLFDDNRNQLPADLLVFVCERLMASGLDADHDYVEEILRGWLVQHSENMSQDDATKALMQLMLAKNFFKARRYDVARAEYNTVVNRYAATPQAIEAEFGIGETFLAQKVYDQAEQVFEKLARSTEVDVVVRAEFLRGVLSFRRGDREEARDIFRGVLERVPNVELANQALFNLAEVYGSEERYIDQLNLLRTVGRLGRASKRRHVPGTPLSIVVHDSDLGISRGHNRIPVKVTTIPGGDQETVYLVGSGAGKGLFRVDLETRLGEASKDDHVLQLTGKDVIKCDYPDEFKAEFKNVPLSDVEIRVAADAKFELASSKIEDTKAETLSQQLARENDPDADKRQSQVRPANQIKPGNPIYLRIKDGDRDLTANPDQVVVKLTADSGDQVQIAMTETGPHTGIFEGLAQTGDLPAGALASDTAIDHSPLMAIDRDPKTFWLSEPDGAINKWLTVDLKDLRKVARVKIETPDAAKQAPVRGELRGSQDGQFWFRIGSHPAREAAPALAAEYGQMTQRLYTGNHTDYATWDQVVQFAKNSKPVEEAPVDTLAYKRLETAQDLQQPFTILWQGKFVQPKSGAVRIQVNGGKTAVQVDGILELPVAAGERSCDLWLEAGPHDLAIFAASANGQQPVEAKLARASLTTELITTVPFRSADFDLTTAAAQKVIAAEAPPTIPLPLRTAQITRKTEQFGLRTNGGAETLGNWATVDDLVAWEFDAPKAGPYEVWMDFSHEQDGGRYQVDVDGKKFDSRVPNTGNWATYRKQRVGIVMVDKVGKAKLSIKPLEIVNGGLLDLKEIWLQPAVGQSLIQEPTAWEFRFPEHELRFVRFVGQEYLGEAIAISNVEVAGTETAELYIPTKEDVLALAANQTLEIAGGDNVTAAYTDEVTLSDSASSQLLTGKLQATYFNASVAAIGYEFLRANNGQVYNERKELKRIDPGERIVIEITDYDEDRTNERDSIPIQVSVNDGEPMALTATETNSFTGIFTKEIDTSNGLKEEKDKLKVKAGDRISLRYYDTHNTFPGHSVPREETVYVVEPTNAVVRVLETRVIPPPEGVKAPPQIVVLPKKKEAGTSGVAFEAPLTIEVIDPDSAKDSRSTTLVKLLTTDGATVEVECAISPKFSDVAPGDLQAARIALEEGRFVGQVILQLGGKNSAALVPLTTEMPRDLVGKVRLGEKATGDAAAANLVTRVLNLSGKDVVTATYTDERRPDGKAAPIVAQGRLISNGQLAVTDREYEKPVVALHVGERIYLRVVDADLDASDARDFATVEIAGELGEKETIKLEETLAHSGIFTGSLQLKAVDKPTAGNLSAADPIIESYFGDQLTVKFVDPTASTETGTLEQELSLTVVVGTDGLVAAFSKAFQNEDLAVETKFRIAESYFELFKSHKDLGRQEEKKVDLENGRRVLREVMEDYPDPKYAPRIAYLLGQFSQELGQWDEAIKSYDLILRQYADHTLAPDAQYKLAQCHEQAGNFDQALEAYVTLAATHPKSPLIPNVMIRIADYFFKNEKYDISAQVGEKFIERFESHSNAPRMAFRIGQCHFKSKKYQQAGKAFDKFTEQYSKDALAGDAFFWSGESYRMGGQARNAFIAYNNCRWKHPDSEAAKYARGRLALPEMLQQFEAEANSVDEDR